MKKSLVSVLGIKESTVGINFTSGEGFNTFSREEAIQAFAIISLTKKNR